MAYEFKLPDLGEGVHEGEIVQWLVKVGDRVRADQPVVEVMTDKVTSELPIPVGGVVARLGGEAGEVIRVGGVLLEIRTEETAPTVEAEPVSAPAELASEAVAPPSTRESAGPAAEGRARAVPAVRRLARELGVDLESINGSGSGGRVVADDVRAAAGEAPGTPTREPAITGKVRRIPLRGKRRLIAEHLLASHRNTAPYTFVEEVDFTELVRLRDRIRPVAEKSGVQVSYLPFVLGALSMALRDHPWLNATVDADTGDLILYDEHHIAIAVHTDEGLVVPVIRNVERRNLLDLAREIERLSKAAREGTLTREDVTGGTFSVTSLGLLGGVMGTPMLNTPQVAVLGVHRISPRAVVRDGNVVARQVANLSLTLDHRYIDGFVGAKFAQTLAGYLEDPAVMLFWLSELRGNG